MLTDLEHKECYRKVQEKFTQFTEGAKLHSSVDDATMLKLLSQWAGKYNHGITGLGIDPEILPISMIRPDVMHLAMTITKSLLKYMHKLMHSRTKQFSLQIEEIMYEFLDDEEMLIWKLNKPIDSYDCTELRKFTKNLDFLANRFNRGNWFL